VSIDCNVDFEGFVFISRCSCMIGCIGDFDGIVGFFLGMVGTARFSSSFSSFHFLAGCSLDDDFGFLAFGNNCWKSVRSFHNTHMPLLSCIFLSHGVVPYCTGRYCLRIVGGVLGCGFWCLWVWTG